MAEKSTGQSSSPSTRAAPAQTDALPEELGLSRDAKHSTYEQAPEPDPQSPAANPPPGPSVIQTLGKPTEASE